MSLSTSISSGGGTGASAPEVIYYDQFVSGVSQAFQQAESKVAMNFETQALEGEFTFFDRVGIAEEMKEDKTRYGDNPQSEIDFDRRRLGRRFFEQGKYIDEKDLEKVLTDTQAPIIQAMIASGKRKMDDIVIERIFDKAMTGHEGDTTVNFARSNSGAITVGEVSRGHSRPIVTGGKYVLDTGDYEGIDIAVDFVDSGTATNTGITLAKLKAARYTMTRLEGIGQNEILDCYITSAQAEQLLGIDEVVNSDYAVRKALAEGAVVTFLGFRFINSERLRGAGTAADPRQCIIAKRDSLRWGVLDGGLMADVWRDTGKKKAPYIYTKLWMDAVRMHGETTVKLNCLD